jgi:hypothetical protein
VFPVEVEAIFIAEDLWELRPSTKKTGC